MRVLVATCETQGKRKNDFCFATEGELVKFPGIECDRETPDGSCGCRRSLGGVESGRATTTLRVVERDLTATEVKAIFFESMRQSGWVKDESWADTVREQCADDAKGLLRIAGSFPVGTVLERRGEVFNVRV